VEQDVSTSFTVVDKATGPLKQMAKAAEAASVGMERTKAAHGAVSRTPIVAAHGTEMAGATEAERERFKVEREELRARRSRMRGLKLAEQRENVIERTAEVASRSLVSSQNVYGAALGKLAMNAESIGYSMSAFTGNMGAFGQKLVQVAGKVVALGAVFEIGYALGEKLNERLERAEKAEEGKRVEEYARASGFRSRAEMVAAQAILEHAGEETNAARQAQELAAKLPGLPVDRMGQSMFAWEKAAVEAATKMGVMPDKLAGLVAAAKSESEKMVKTLAASMNREVELNDMREKLSKKYNALAEGTDPELVKAQNDSIARDIQWNVEMGKVKAAEAASLFQQTLDRVAERESVVTSMEQYRKLALTQDMVDAELKQMVKEWKATPLKKPEQLFSLHAEVARQTEKVAKAYDLSAEQAKEFAGKLSQAKMEKSRVAFDFRNSRFDIKQAFAEGFDPDRIAVAFANDLATMGERRLMSGFSPIYGAR